MKTFNEFITENEVIEESTEIGKTRYVSVTTTDTDDWRVIGPGVQITGLNGMGKTNPRLLNQKGAYIQIPTEEIPKLINLLKKAI